MSVIYLVHPTHGAKVAISDMEAALDIQNGWDWFDPNEPTQAEDCDDEATSDAETLAESVNELQPRRRGRRPKEATT